MSTGRLRSVAVLGLALGALLVWGAGALADPHVYVDPPFTVALPDDVFELSVMAEDTGDLIASTQLYVSYDPAVVELTAAADGDLYTSGSWTPWSSYGEVSPGVWHCFVTLLGIGSYVEPPGELIHLTFQAVEGGETQTVADTLRMTDSDRAAYPVVTFDPGTILVAPSSGVHGGSDALVLGPAHPNPFLEGTRLAYALPAGTRGWSVRVYDVAGREVAQLRLPADSGGGVSGDLLWDGTTDAGDAAPAGVYFLKLAGGLGERWAKAVKLR
jgi:hypothetical protein